MANFQIRQVYNFDTYAAALLGNNFKNVTVLAIMDRETAAKEADVHAMHVQVYPYLPAGTPNDPNAYDYVKVKTTTGQTMILGIAWIKEDSIQLVESRIITVKISNVSASDIPRVRDALVANGFNQVEMSISN